MYSLLSSSTYVYDMDNDHSVLIEAKELVERFDGLKIEIYSNEHPPPHFHVIFGGIKSSFSLDDCRMLEGNLPSKQRKKIQYWFHNKKAKNALIEIWNKTRPDGCVVGKYIEQV
jgi:hypothetical protein